MSSAIVSAGTAAAVWRVLCGSGPVPKAIARLVDTLSDHLEIKNDLARAKVASGVARIEANSANEVRALQANADHGLKLFEMMAAADRAKLWDQLREEKRLRNRERVLEQTAAVLQGTPDAEVADGVRVDPDWTAQFFNHVQDIGDEQMQAVWARLLAGEVKRPGSFGLRTLERVRSMTKAEAEAFTRLCSVTWRGPSGETWALTDRQWVHARMEGKSSPLTFDYSDCLLAAECGLIEIADTYQTIWMPPAGFYLEYFGDGYLFRNPTAAVPKVQLNAGTFHWTRAGRELGQIAEGERNERYLDAILDFHRGAGWQIDRAVLTDGKAVLAPPGDHQPR